MECPKCSKTKLSYDDEAFIFKFNMCWDCFKVDYDVENKMRSIENYVRSIIT